MSDRPVRRIDGSALQGLAHPLRVQLYDALVSEGPATASALGRRLGESSGATSYHLRQLERHGFVETDPDRGTGRERWWRAVREDTSLHGEDFEDDPVAARAQQLVSNEWDRTRRSRYERWRTGRGAWPKVWRQAAEVSTTYLALDPQEAEQLAAELHAVLVTWADRLADTRTPDPVHRPVEVQLSIFPNGEPPKTE